MEEDQQGFVGTPFAVVPEWVLYSTLSDRALRLYVVLQRHVNSSEGYARPGRQRLCKLLAVSERTLDAAMQELVAYGAVQVRAQYREGTQVRAANRYYLRTDRPTAEGVGHDTAPPLGQPPAPPVGHDTAPLERELFLNDTGVATPHRSVTAAVKVSEDQGTLDGMPPPTPLQPRARARDLLWDTFGELLGPVAHQGERGKRQRACRLVREALQGMPPAVQASHLRERIALAQREWGKRGIHVTDIGVANQWTLLGRMVAVANDGVGGGLTAEQIFAQAVDEGLEL